MTEERAPDWAIQMACDELNQENKVFIWKPERYEKNYIVRVLANRIARTEKERVDPLVLEVRKMCADHCTDRSTKDSYLSGSMDNTYSFKVSLAAMRRGFELGREKGK